MIILARIIGFVILVQGVFGLVMPDLFFQLVRAFQVPPVLYVAAVVRVAFGVVLLQVAGKARMSLGLRILGGFMVIGGLLTPFFGVAFAEVILRNWSEGGAPIVRVWAAGSLAIGIFILFAMQPKRLPMTKEGGTT